MTNTAALTPAQHLGNLAQIMTVLLDDEACADRALQMETNLGALEALAATPTGTLARRVKEAVDVRLGAETILARGMTTGLHMAAALSLACRVAVEVEAALVIAGAEGSAADMPAEELDALRLAMGAARA